MDELLMQYLPILVFLIIAFGLGTVMIAIPFIVNRLRPDVEKESQYECGFAAFDNARVPFDIRFYMVSIMFIIFDLEISFMFPWAVALTLLPEFGFWSMMVFLLVLFVGFIYEWRKGALEWK